VSGLLQRQSTTYSISRRLCRFCLQLVDDACKCNYCVRRAVLLAIRPAAARGTLRRKRGYMLRKTRHGYLRRIRRGGVNVA